MAGSTFAPNLLAVVCVFADYHRQLVNRAAASVAAQTLPCDWIVVEDTTGAGPAAGRNQAVQEVRSPFVTFLDADDTLLPDFATEMLSRWMPGHYVYCDWMRDGKVERLPDRFPLPDSPQLHLNTCVIHRETFLRLDGYRSVDYEDSEFWFRAMTRGICGIHCPLPLVEYSADGQRSAEARARVPGSYLQNLYERTVGMGCCGKQTGPTTPSGAKQPGDVLAQATWGGNHVRFGQVTGRQYPYTGNGKLLWMSPLDAAAAPNWYQIVEEPLPPESVDMQSLKSQIEALSRAQK